MKRMKLILILSLFSALLKAPDIKTIPILVSEAVNPYTPIVNAVSFIESSDGMKLINKKENAVGWFGIRPNKLQDYNDRTGQNITHDQCYDYETGKKILLWYISQCDYRNVLGMSRAWNGKSTKNIYYSKIMKQLHK